MCIASVAASAAGRLVSRARRPPPYVQIEPLLVAEVEVDTAVDRPLGRHRHRVRPVRLRPDLAPHDVPPLSARL
ncbi:hypothetical protein [Nucisporomicrobium flavum]|uniref:hypothetical protein n=1 Tax=Nucisporomicrobium flavum TaxID=2785915 RepID=UPI0018F7C9C2|nr:hypothetical protein [Nucisporomicrobium flavum]